MSLEPSRVTENTALCLINSFAKSTSDIAERSAVNGRRDRDEEYSKTICSCAAKDLAMPQMQGGRSTQGIGRLLA
jgi:hypothetical protein